MVRSGLKPNVYTHTVLIDGLCKKGWTEKAFRLFLKLVRSDNYKPNVHTYTAMISGYCKEEKLNRAEMLLVKMQEQGIAPNWNTFTTLIDGHAKVGDFDRAYELMDVMAEDGLTPNICTYNAVIDALCKKGRVKEAYRVSMLDEARALFEEMIGKGISPCEVTRMTIAYEFCKKDESCTAMALLDRLEKKLWVRTISTLVRKLCSEQKVDMAAQFFDKLFDVNHTVDRVTLAAFMTACYDSNNYALVSDISERITKQKDGIGFFALILSIPQRSFKLQTCSLRLSYTRVIFNCNSAYKSKVLGSMLSLDVICFHLSSAAPRFSSIQTALQPYHEIRRR
ncbi:UNVERIFIED_CONTAM: Pentatricopeptide repeat-containing protein [Sesamum calycinum]|uniref:Pentatricopeptide repeat-containing protein n=1 Tax=Sesamum calycinum TaxID=2727403 RepID=A0AAW2Q816_9LAMI